MGLGRLAAATRKETEVWDWCTQGDIRVMLGEVGERRCGWWESRLSAKRVPALSISQSKISEEMVQFEGEMGWCEGFVVLISAGRKNVTRERM